MNTHLNNSEQTGWPLPPLVRRKLSSKWFRAQRIRDVEDNQENAFHIDILIVRACRHLITGPTDWAELDQFAQSKVKTRIEFKRRQSRSVTARIRVKVSYIQLEIDPNTLSLTNSTHQLRSGLRSNGFDPVNANTASGESWLHLFQGSRGPRWISLEGVDFDAVPGKASRCHAEKLVEAHKKWIRGDKIENKEIFELSFRMTRRA
ncbi:hypothetical protein B0H14DRAFT_2614161 [Mycena olivaceomarginata]|nr:hypothetical protein B0H14DRAFT_2614161 [Mycena olivaceomarginata]